MNFVLDRQRFGRKYQGSIYSTASAQASEFMAHLPFPLAVNRRVLRAVLPAISLSMVLYPAWPDPSQYVRPREYGSLEASYPWQPEAALAGELADVSVCSDVGRMRASRVTRVPDSGFITRGRCPMPGVRTAINCTRTGASGGTRSVYVSLLSGASLFVHAAHDLTPGSEPRTPLTWIPHLPRPAR